MTTSRSRRVVLSGSEGTGKTTLARQLAEHFRAPWTPEYAREYAETVARPLHVHDVESIARGQIAVEESALAARPTLVFFDTDLVSTLVYARHYYDEEPAWLAPAVRDRLADLYLLLDTDLEWQPDGVRDQPHARERVQALFRQQLAALGARVVDVRGDEDERFRIARAAVNELIRGSASDKEARGASPSDL